MQITATTNRQSNVDPYRLVNPNENGAVRAQVNRVIRVCLCVVAAVTLCFACYFAWEFLRDPDIGGYADESIEFVGIDADGSGDVYSITPSMLGELKCEQLSVKGVGMGSGGASKAGVVGVYGPELNTLLAHFGYSTSDFRKIKFYCKDGYKVIIRGETLSYKIYLSIASGKNALYDKQKPLRIVIPEEQSGKWAYGVTKIEFFR